jgi:hypothetical protein
MLVASSFRNETEGSSIKEDKSCRVDRWHRKKSGKGK